MKRLQPYILLLLSLIAALLRLGYEVIRQVIIPTRSRKGNLLFSIFLLFAGLTEEVIGFCEAIARISGTFSKPAAFNRAWAFGRKYCRQGLMVVSWALFILSSAEWTSPRPVGVEPAAAEQWAETSTGTVQRQTTVAAAVEANPFIPLSQESATPLLANPPSSSTPRWLSLRALRL